MKVELQITDGTLKGTSFVFTEHDTFLFGRSRNSKCRIPDDKYVSRNHFLLEITPPKVWLKDLGSLNGTFVNDVKFGRKKSDNQQKINADEFSWFMNKHSENRNDFETEIFHNDTITVGNTKISVTIEHDVACSKCGEMIDSSIKENFKTTQNHYVCKNCQEKQRLRQDEQTVIQTPQQDKQISEAPRFQQSEKNTEAEKFAADFIMKLLNEVNDGKPQIVQSFPGYKVLRKLGEGGMGAVYLAQDIKTNQQVAIKIIKPQSVPNPQQIARFRREGELSYALKHHNIVRCYKTDYSSGIYYIVMEYVDGTDMQKLIHKHKLLDIKTSCNLIINALEGLKYMHANKVVHRDIKPPNILIEQTNNKMIPKITDFGLAKNLETSVTITAKGDIAGSIPFMAPEQIFDFKNITPAADIFSLGATLYTVCSGQYIHDYPRNKDPFLVNIQEPIIPIEKRLPGIPEKIAHVINRSIAMDIRQRTQTAEEFQRLLIEAIR